MSASKMLISLARRSYSTRKHMKKPGQRAPNPGIQQRLRILEDGPEDDVKSTDDLDFENVETDFMDVHNFYGLHKKEEFVQKEKVKLRIVARKYFNKVEPSFLTFIEMEQIRHLHDNDPVEYTPEKLSESFPSLPHIIRKILKSRWTPRSADRVMKHDQQVIDNWKSYKRGELQLDPKLAQHLEKFKHRRISLPDKEEVEKKLIPPPLEFPKPKSSLYSGIIQGYLQQTGDESQTDNQSAAVHLDNKDGENYEDLYANQPTRQPELLQKFIGITGNDRATSQNTYGKQIAIQSNKAAPKSKVTDLESVTLDEFFKDVVKNVKGEPSIEDKVVMDTYKRTIESKIFEDHDTDRSISPNLVDDSDELSSAIRLNDNDLQTVVQKQEPLGRIKVVNDAKESGLETYVKVWEKKASQEEEYPEFINIPKSKYKKGKLYRVRDCYYDHDGEFLYRVPGLKN